MAIFNTSSLTPPSSAGLLPADAGKASVCQATESLGWLDVLHKLAASGVTYDDQEIVTLNTNLVTLHADLATLNTNLQAIQTAIAGIALNVSAPDLAEIIQALHDLRYNSTILDFGRFQVFFDGKNSEFH